MMQNAMVKTKREGGQIFRLVGLVGSIWHPKLQLCLEGASFSNRHTVSANFSPSDPFSFSLILTFFASYPCFRLTLLLCSSPHASATTPMDAFSQRGCQEKRSAAQRFLNLALIFRQSVATLNEMAIMLPDVFSLIFCLSPSLFSLPPKYFPPAFSRANIVTQCDGAAVDSGPKQNGG